MPIPTYTFWCTKTYTGPWLSYSYTYSQAGSTSVETRTEPGYDLWPFEKYTSSDSTTTVTYTSSRPASTITYTHISYGYTKIDEHVEPHPDFYPYGRDPCVENTPTDAWAIPVGVILGLSALGFIIAGIVYKKRQRKRKAWYRPMATYYQGGPVKPRVTGA